MTAEMATESDLPPITELSARQRRVLGVLVEKAFTTPEYYPLTLKAVTTGCNQKSNRAPAVQYTEDEVLDTLDELREMALVAVVHTESGRTERYRHYVRRRFTLSEPQIAILTELLLRSRQQLGELRSRASRMVPIDSLQQLRQEVAGLIEMNLARSGGPLERRGVEVDHNLYPASERTDMAVATGEPTAEQSAMTSAAPPPTQAPAGPLPEDLQTLKTQLEHVQARQQEMQDLVNRLEETVGRMQNDIDDLKRDLGV